MHSTTDTTFDFAPLLAPGLPPAAMRWTGRPKFDFTGGNNDPDQLPLQDLIAATETVLKREGRSLSTYSLNSGPQGYRPLREFLVKKLLADAAIQCTVNDILITSGSLQAIDLINHTLLTRGDTVIIEEDCYQGSINRLLRMGVNPIGIPLNEQGMRIDVLASVLNALSSKGVRPKYIYTIPTVQNPSSTIMPTSHRERLLQLAHTHGVPIFEDDCYADLTWSGERPPALYAMSPYNNVIHIGSFSKSIAPALRVGFIVASWNVLSHILSLKTDAGSGALEQMVLAEYCQSHFGKHIVALRKGLHNKFITLKEALHTHFGDAVSFDDVQGGIFLWVTLPEHIDTLALFQQAQAAGVAINPGPEWSVNKPHARNRMRLCFASLSHEEIHQGVATLAQVYRSL